MAPSCTGVGVVTFFCLEGGGVDGVRKSRISPCRVAVVQFCSWVCGTVSSAERSKVILAWAFDPCAVGVGCVIRAWGRSVRSLCALWRCGR
eukprot:152147-Rhodomonas_salina.1